MSRLRPLRLTLLSFALLSALTGTILVAKTRFVDFGHSEGLFLLRGRDGNWFQLQNDLFLGDGSRLIFGLDWEWLENWWRERGHGSSDTYLTYEWDDASGYGYVISHFPKGQELLTNFSRYDDSYGLHTRGLFVGGALPESARDDTAEHQADTGMAWSDGDRWYHLWCNTNEGIASAVVASHRYPPHRWQFLGSRVLIASSDKLVLESRHLIDIDQTRLLMERYAYFAAGEPYFGLGIKLTNVGPHPVDYDYLYADEPWVGDYGSSTGDIGWIESDLAFTEGFVDPRRHHYAGIADRGNPLTGEQGPFTGVANFINWLGDNLPDRVYFANDFRGPVSDGEPAFPLAGNARSIGLAWISRHLNPGQSHKIFLRLGIAALDPSTSLPSRPPLYALPNF